MQDNDPRTTSEYTGVSDRDERTTDPVMNDSATDRPVGATRADRDDDQREMRAERPLSNDPTGLSSDMPIQYEQPYNPDPSSGGIVGGASQSNQPYDPDPTASLDDPADRAPRTATGEAMGPSYNDDPSLLADGGPREDDR